VSAVSRSARPRLEPSRHSRAPSAKATRCAGRQDGGAHRGGAAPLRRRDLARRLLADRGDLLVVAGLGSTAWDVTAAGDHPLTFPLWGAMGGAAMIGLGLALAQPARRVLVITGDGELLMGLGSLATIAVQRPPNLAIVVFDNERYGEAGMQATHTAHGVDLPAVAAACGFPLTGTLREEPDVEVALPVIRTAPGLILYVAKVRAEPLPFALPPKDGAYLKDRFRHALLGEA
jgi:thiamine pyrophosphate-dependent acetolactate synthase large subunit-like protein